MAPPALAQTLAALGLGLMGLGPASVHQTLLADEAPSVGP